MRTRPEEPEEDGGGEIITLTYSCGIEIGIGEFQGTHKQWSTRPCGAKP